MNFMTLSTSLNRNFYMNISIQGNRNVVQVDEFDSAMLCRIERMTFQAFLIEIKRYSVFFCAFSLFSEAVWNRVVVFLTVNTVFPNLSFDFLIGSVVCVNLILGFGSKKSERKVWGSSFDVVNNFHGWIKSMKFFVRNIFSINKFYQCMKWNVGFIAVDVCLTCRLWAKFFNCLRNPWMKISLHLRLIVAADSLHLLFLLNQLLSNQLLNSQSVRMYAFSSLF